VEAIIAFLLSKMVFLGETFRKYKIPQKDTIRIRKKPTLFFRMSGLSPCVAISDFQKKCVFFLQSQTESLFTRDLYQSGDFR